MKNEAPPRLEKFINLSDLLLENNIVFQLNQNKSDLINYIYHIMSVAYLSWFLSTNGPKIS